MKILHFSDTHLGYNDLDILNEDNINQREADFYDAFTQVVDDIKEIKPDYVIHTGDLFHRTSPSNRAITFALEQFRVLDETGIPFIIIAGNHETPRTNLSSPILKICEGFDNIYGSFLQEYKKIEFEDIVFHTLPHMNDETKASQEILKCEENLIQDKKNIMMMHCSVGAGYLMEEFGEWVYPKDKEDIFKKMDYVALGHWHGFGGVGKHPNVYYSGSTERTSLNDKRNSKGYALITIEDQLKVEYKKIDIRPIRLKQIDCSDYETSIAALDTTDSKDAIVEVVLKDITPLQSIDISNNDIKELFLDALSISVKREFKKEQRDDMIGDIESVSLEEYFLDHIKEDIEDKEELKRLNLKTKELFRRYEEQNNDPA